MANHVNTYVRFYEINDEAKAKLQEMYSRVREDQNYKWFSDIFVDGAEGSPTYEETEQYSWTTENIGPKWCYFEDYDEDGFSCTSAWSAPEQGLIKLLEILEEYDPNMITTFQYEDEAPNFFGAYVYEGSELYDGREDDDEEIRELIEGLHPEITEHWDEENEEWSDEGRDIWHDNIWSDIGDVQCEVIDGILESIKQDREENGIR
jgi:hypothetical protein